MAEKKVSEQYIIWQPLLMGVMVAVGILLGYKMNDRADMAYIQELEPSAQAVEIGRVEELIRFIESKYVDNVNSEELIEEAINGVLYKLDPHSVYLSPSKVMEVDDKMGGTFRGIGIESFSLEDAVFVLKVLDGSPAMRAGVKMFDQILSINDSTITGNVSRIEELKKLLNEREKTFVQLELKNALSGELKQVKIDFDDIVVNSVSNATMVDSNSALIKLDQFTGTSYKDFMKAMETLAENNKVDNLIIDLRGNPGGYLPQATRILNQLFNEKDQLMVYTEGRNSQKSEYKSNGKAFYPLKNVAVLVDEESASGSEIIAAAIQDWDRGPVIGRTTYGKGLVQEQYGLSNGGAIRLTTARYYTPAGRSIQRDYTDLVEYDNDVFNRFEDGSLFFADSIRHDTTAAIFKTLILKRPVHANGGVDPDIFIPADSTLFDAQFHSARIFASEFVFRSMLRNSKLNASDFDKEMTWDAYIASLIKNRPAFDPKSIFPYEKEKLIQKMKSDFLYFAQDQAGRTKFELSNDTFIQVALKYFKNPSLKDL